ncbi:uncharacterized protein LOC144442831 [Glandiceps talaboti]
MAANLDLSGELKTTPEKTNYARLCRLLIDGGTRALREVFDSIHPPHTLTNALTQPANKIILNKLKPKVINRKEWNMLYPMSGIPVSSMNFDITLLTVLLRNICNLQKPKTGWDNLPPISNRSKEADIARIKFYRNKLCHGKTTSVTEFHFHGYWNDTADALERLGVKRDDIDKLETVSMDSEQEQRYIDDLREWKRKEEESEDLIQTILKMIDSREADKIYCDKHRNDHLSMFCKECVVMICSVCERLNHSGHKIIDTDVAVKCWRDGLPIVISHIEQKLTEAQNSLQKAQEEVKRLTEDFDDIQKQIHNLTNAKDKQRELTQKLKHQYENMMGDIGNEVKELEKNANIMGKALKYFKTVISLENDTKLLTECPTINDHLIQIYSQKIVMTKKFYNIGFDVFAREFKYLTLSSTVGL